MGLDPNGNLYVGLSVNKITSNNKYFDLKYYNTLGHYEEQQDYMDDVIKIIKSENEELKDYSMFGYFYFSIIEEHGIGLYYCTGTDYVLSLSFSELDNMYNFKKIFYKIFNCEPEIVIFVDVF